jgi:hypothetical protein
MVPPVVGIGVGDMGGSVGVGMAVNVAGVDMGVGMAVNVAGVIEGMAVEMAGDAVTVGVSRLLTFVVPPPQAAIWASKSRHRLAVAPIEQV